MNRREFLQSGTTLALGVSSLEIANMAWPDAAPVRRAVNGLAAGDPIVRSYAKAVDLMKQLPETKARNWRKQASIHNNYCPHDNWWFLPFHRAYLYYFENACRDVLNDPSFTVPYWDWTRHRKIPDPFLDSASPLWSPGRTDDGKIELAEEIVGERVITNIIESDSLVDLFSSPTTHDEQRQHVSAGTLEFTPHNGVHGTISGDMNTYLSPLDPIFWLHHANVDRIWASWAKVHDNQAPTRAPWSTHQLAAFFDAATGLQAAPPAADTLDASKFRANYDHYETISGPTPRASAHSLRSAMIGLKGKLSSAFNLRHFAADSAGRDIPLGQAGQVHVPVTGKFIPAIQKAASENEPTSDAERTVVTYLLIENVPPPKVLSTAMRVFLNCKDASLATPLDDPTYVGTVAFFGGGSHDIENASGVTFTINVTATLARVIEKGIYAAGTPISVGIVAVDLANLKRKASSEVLRPERIRLVGLEVE